MIYDPPALGGGSGETIHTSHGPGYGPVGMYGPGAYGEKDPQDGDGVEISDPPALMLKPTAEKQPPLLALVAEAERWICQADRAVDDYGKEEALSLVLVVLFGLLPKISLDREQIGYCIGELERIKQLPGNELLSEVWERKKFNPLDRALGKLRSQL